MEGTLNALQTSVGSSISQGIAGLQAQIDELKQQLANVASEEDLNAINENLTGVNEDLEELLQSSNVFSGDLVISSDATLEFAEALGDKVAIVNGNVDITLQTAMDNARIQAVANKFNPNTQRKELGLFPKYSVIASHDLRRSFATNFFGKIPTPGAVDMSWKIPTPGEKAWKKVHSSRGGVKI